MFTLELDLVLAYIPPMIERRAGICLTREIQLPFAPYNGLQLYGKQLDQAPGPEGFVLKDVMWDVDREVFMGHFELISHDLPMEDIPLDIGAWLGLGWRFGSCGDRYEEDEEDGQDRDVEDDGDDSFIDQSFEDELKLPTRSPRERSKRFNLVMRAMVRVMAETHNNLEVAYAMDKTKRHFTEKQLKDNKTKHTEAWIEAQIEYNKMGWQQREAWRERVMKTHPRLDKLSSE